MGTIFNGGDFFHIASPLEQIEKQLFFYHHYPSVSIDQDMLITMPLTREDANVLCFSCSTGLHLSHIAFVKCPIGGKSLTDLIGTHCILCQHMPMQDRKRSRALRGGCNILKPLPHGQTEALSRNTSFWISRVSIPPKDLRCLRKWVLWLL